VRDRVIEGTWTAEVAKRLRNLLAAKDVDFVDLMPDLVISLGMHERADNVVLKAASSTAQGARLSCLLDERLRTFTTVAADATLVPSAPLTLTLKLGSVHTATMTDPFDAYADAIAYAVETSLQ
jgi:hypothetical protein